MILLPLVSVLVLLVFLAGVLGLFLSLERRAARLADMSEATPVCGACHYRLGGWTSSTCPECGVDVRVSRVRVGARTSLWVWTFLLVMLSVMVVGPLSLGTLRPLFQGEHGDLNIACTSSTLPKLLVAVESQYTRFGLAASFETQTTIHATWFVDGLSGTWNGAAYRGNAEPRTQSFSFSGQTGPATPETVEAALRTVVDDDTDEAAIHEHVAAIEAICDFIHVAGSDGSLELNRLQELVAASATFSGLSGSDGWGPRSHWLGTVLPLCVVLIALWFSVRLPARFARSGWRSPRDGEWAGVDAGASRRE